MLLSRRLTTVVVLVVTIGWAVNLAASIAPWIDYEADPLVHAAFMAIVGGALGLQARRVPVVQDEEDT